MTINDTIAANLVERFGAIRADDIETTRRNEFIDQVELQLEDACVIAVGRSLAKAKAIAGRRAALQVSVYEDGSEQPEGTAFLFADDAALILAIDWIKSGADLDGESTAINHATGAVQRNAGLVSNTPGDQIHTLAAPMSETAAVANDHVARTLAALDHGAADIADPVEAVPASVHRVAVLLGCSVEAAAYIDALETRVARLEELVSELRYDIRKARYAA